MAGLPSDPPLAELEPNKEELRMGPLKGLFLLLANIKPLGAPSPMAASSNLPDPDSTGGGPVSGFCPIRLKRPVLEKEPAVGVAGKTFTEVCGERPLTEREAGELTVSNELEDWDEALLWAGRRGMERTEETEDEVDFRPRRPDERR